MTRLVVKKCKWDNITPTLCDDLHWLLVRQRVPPQDSSSRPTGLPMPTPAPSIVLRVDDHSSVDSFN